MPKGLRFSINADPGRYDGTATSADGTVTVSFTKEIDTGVNARVTVQGDF